MDFVSKQYTPNIWNHDIRHSLLRPWSFQLWSYQTRSNSQSDLSEKALHSVEQYGGDSISQERSQRQPSLSRSLDGPKTVLHRPDWWQNRMLFDRSILSMAALTTLYALIMTILCASKMKAFANRPNTSSTSVGLNHKQKCADMKKTEIVIALFINIAATTVLGMSNTYQQLLTSLDVNEVRWTLSKFGDCRVGTNSPTTINRKQHGKAKAWACWLLLICTSLPIHFFANSVIGPSIYMTTPTNITFIPSDVANVAASNNLTSEQSSGISCWILFRTGSAYGWDKAVEAERLEWYDFMYDTVNVFYSRELCAEYFATTDVAGVESELKARSDTSYYHPTIGGCTSDSNVACQYSDETETKCRLSIRMSAALILTGCLILKACYMLVVNVRGRGRQKTQCLTFGDVVISSVLDRALCIHNECMVNAKEACRHITRHECHKHCTSQEKSRSGDELGHCQNCRKFNQVDKAADLVHPCIATKYKKSLLSNLGTAALTQMLLLWLASLSMLVASLMLAYFFASRAISYNETCRLGANAGAYVVEGIDCHAGRGHDLATKFGGFGGFDSTAELGTLTVTRAGSEMLAFAVSNGAQLLYSLLYLLLIYNFTLISMEHDWGKLEKDRSKLRCTLARGKGFRDSYLLQLPKWLLFPMMTVSSLMHWLLSQALSTTEIIKGYYPSAGDRSRQSWEFSEYRIVFGAYSVWLATILMISMTAVCWWAFTYKREGFIPQMYGSIRVCCAATTQLVDYSEEGVKWGDLKSKGKFRHAGFSIDEVGPIEPADLYAGEAEDLVASQSPHTPTPAPSATAIESEKKTQ